MKTIGEVAELFNIPISTLRFYDKEGLLPDLKRESSGIRKFDEQSIEAIKVIECLKKSGTSIKDIKQFMDWCTEGPSTYPERYNLFDKQKSIVEQEIKKLQTTLAMIEFKRWYYNQALQDGNEAFSKNIPDILPEEIKAYYNQTH